MAKNGKIIIKYIQNSKKNKKKYISLKKMFKNAKNGKIIVSCCRFSVTQYLHFFDGANGRWAPVAAAVPYQVVVDTEDQSISIFGGRHGVLEEEQGEQDEMMIDRREFIRVDEAGGGFTFFYYFCNYLN
jgi:hypothetical protein